jgi:hypothetical protein
MFLLPVVMRKHPILLRQHAPQTLGSARIAPVLPVLSGRDQVTARRIDAYSSRHVVFFSQLIIS